MSDAPIRIDLEAAESFQRVAHVSVEPAHIESLRERAARKLAKKVKMAGFRPGKVPPRIVRAQMPAEVEQEAFEALVPEVYRQILQENEDIHPVADPRVENLDVPEEGGVHFDLSIEVRPELEITGLEDIEVTRHLPPITEEQVDKALEAFVERQGHWEDKEDGHAAEGDAVLIDTVPLDAQGQAIDAEAEVDHPVLVGSDGNLPEINAALVGMQAGEETEVEVNYPVDFPIDDLKGTTRTLRLKVKEVRTRVLPELDEAFVREHTQFESVEELRTRTREQLEKRVREESDRHLRDQLIERLLERNEVPVPPSLEARYLQAILTDLAKSQGGEKPLEFDEQTKAKLAEAYRPMARRAVQRMVLVDNLRRAHDLKVSDEELKARIAEMAQEQGSSPEQLEGLIRRAGNLERLRSDMEEEKVFALLEEKAKVTVSEEAPAEAGQSDSGDKE